MDLAMIATIVGIVSTGVVILQNFTKVIDWIAGKWQRLFGSNTSPNEFPIPKRSLILQPARHPRTCRWHEGTTGQDDQRRPIMFIVGGFTVTNITKYNVVITGAKMRRPRMRGSAMTKAHDQNLYDSRHHIPPGALTEVHFDFIIDPPIRLKGEAFSADIAIVDQFGNDHWEKKVIFPFV